jgi:uncharacterized protein YjbJ (UPF0337 family)
MSDTEGTAAPADETPDVPESPATWGNVVDGEIKKIVGHLVGDEELTEEGDEQIEIAHETREKYREEHEH